MAETRLMMLSSRAANPVDTVTVVCLRIELYTTPNRSDDAVDVCLTYVLLISRHFAENAT